MTASVPVIVSPKSHCYLDVPYAESSANPGQAERRGRVGQRVYSPKTVAESFDWEPAEALGPGRAAHVSGVEAAIWTETIADFDDASCCWPASHTRLGATHKSPPGPTTAIVSLDTADCGRETASRTSAPPPSTGFSVEPHGLFDENRMSAFGTKRTSHGAQLMSAFGGKADIDRECGHVRF